MNRRRREALQIGRPDLIPKELTREETLEAFDYECDLRLHIINVLEQTLEDPDPTVTNQEDVILRCLLKDRMFLKFGIE